MSDICNGFKNSTNYLEERDLVHGKFIEAVKVNDFYYFKENHRQLAREICFNISGYDYQEQRQHLEDHIFQGDYDHHGVNSFTHIMHRDEFLLDNYIDILTVSYLSETYFDDILGQFPDEGLDNGEFKKGFYLLKSSTLIHTCSNGVCVYEHCIDTGWHEDKGENYSIIYSETIEDIEKSMEEGDLYLEFYWDKLCG